MATESDQTDTGACADPQSIGTYTESAYGSFQYDADAAEDVVSDSGASDEGIEG